MIFFDAFGRVWRFLRRWQPCGTFQQNDRALGGRRWDSASLVRQLRSGISYAILMNKNDKYEGSGVRRDYPMDMKSGIDRAITRAGY